MTEEAGPITGGCMCGAVRYEASGDPLSVIFCHCESCRKNSGAPVVALAGYKRDCFRFTQGDRASYMCGAGTYPMGSVSGTSGYMCSQEVPRQIESSGTTRSRRR
jgi:hypothetical protein